MKRQPLAFLIRPKRIEDFIGQQDILGQGKILRKLILEDKVTSLIFYGPPGTGKSTLAHIIAHTTDAAVINLNAVTSKIEDIRKSVRKAEEEPQRQTILILDEIHRFNKAQQDGLLPHVEDGTLVLIGITTENPFFYINKPLISRSSVFEFRPLVKDDLIKIKEQAVSYLNQESGILLEIDEKAELSLYRHASGDARKLINALEILIDWEGPKVQPITQEDLERLLPRKTVNYDRSSDIHYDTISAFIKSVRGSDPDAAIYWSARMLEAGEPPEFIARRLIILASEDIGNADPMGLVIANAGYDACRNIGMPEARIILAQVITYLATAPKSNSSYLAMDQALGDIRNNKIMEVPEHLRDSNYWSREKLGHGKGYIYPHDHKWHFVSQVYLPEKKEYYIPGDLGFEKKIKERLAFLKKLKPEENK